MSLKRALLTFKKGFDRSYLNDAGWSSPVARRAHNPKVVGSNPAPATNFNNLMTICDPIHGYIHFNQEERKLVENNFFQRLRWIEQLGFVHYAYPSGVSNRFIHSVGACDLAGRVFDSIFSKELIKKFNLAPKKQQQFKKLVKYAALLHDIGHGPLSHTSEFFMPQLKDLNVSCIHSPRSKACHEDYTVKIILESSLSNILKELYVDFIPLIQLIHSETKGDNSFFNVNGINYFPVLKQIISSDLDVDRMDYLHRDSYFCGVKYGEFDFYWMISNFNAHLQDDSVYLAFNKEALFTAENFLLGRYYLHSTVYYHHKPVIYDQMLRKALKDWVLPTDIEQYRQIVDRDIFNYLKKETHNEWAHRILDQKPYKRLYESFETKDKSKNIKKVLDKHNIEHIETHSLQDSLKPIEMNSKKFPIFIKTPFSKDVERLNEKTDSLLKHHAHDVYRIYVPPEKFEQAKKIVF